MKQLFILVFCILGLASFSHAEQSTVEEKKEAEQSKALERRKAGKERVEHSVEMKEDTDGVLEKNEYTVISTNNSVTRSLCPYTCEMRNIPAAHCKQWKSVREPEKCYVQDLRLPSEAIPFDSKDGKERASK